MPESSLTRHVKNLPYLKQIFREVERLRLELDQAVAGKQALANEKSILEAERGALIAGRDSLAAAVRVLEDAVRVLGDELRSVGVERDALGVRATSLASENSSLSAEKSALEAEVSRLRTWTAPGHFYSPFPAPEEILLKEHEIWPKPLPRKEIPGVDMNEEGQLRLFREFLGYYREQPFTPRKQDRLRYYFENENYSYSDAIFLYCMLRHLRPRRYIEVGSGFSSCVTLDTDELFLGSTLSCTFIDPQPELLLSLIKEEDKPRIEINGRKVQDVDIHLFSELGEGDVLFIDSTHVVKALSDVNHIFFNVLPRLQRGVLIHVHDVFYPFVYPKDWELEKRGWNEAYVLRAFLQYNSAFEVYFCNTFLEYFYDAEFKREMPLCMKNTGGSIWLRKIR